ncbi:MAG: translesion DNA synthesis-associated protein ImuA [Motiliproteus sp.]|nr:translesion DNA synthesis-associated protein ImuA [Motiliproteus sp.]MCW9052034.1 translesion DNA synthesis-associated protein ImuA [Motiliproteus sp.]
MQPLSSITAPPKNNDQPQQQVTSPCVDKDPRLQPLLQQGRIWQAGDHQQHSASSAETLSSGYPLLDQQLIGDGWQTGNLVELLYDRNGSGELRLLLPTLAKLSQQPRWILWVNPPHIPYAPALQAAGVDTSKILMVHSQSHQDQLWTLEQALKSGGCSAVLGWLGEVQDKSIRRLQVAASDSGALGFVFRPQQYRQNSSSAPYRICLHPTNKGVDITLIKRKNGWAMPTLQLALGEDQLLHRQPKTDSQFQASNLAKPQQPDSQSPHLRLVR